MAKARAKRQKPDENGQITINSIQVRTQSIDRGTKDMGDYKSALQAADSISWPSRVRLLDIYIRARMDAHLDGIIDKRIRSITNKKIHFMKGGVKLNAYDTLTNSIKFKKMIKEIINAKFDSVCGFEFIPGATFDYNEIPKKHINLAREVITSTQGGQEGSSYAGVWNIIIHGCNEELGEMQVLAPLAILKSGNWGDWAEYIEIFGMPVVQMLYDSYNEEIINELDALARKAGSSQRLIAPKGTEISLIDGKTSNGNGDLQNSFRKAINEEMSVKVLGGTETTNSSNSSGYAQGKIHLTQQEDIIKDDMDDLVKELNTEQYRTIFKSYGFPEYDEVQFEEDVDLDKVAKKLSIATNASKLVPVDDDAIYEITSGVGINKPKNYDALKKQKEEQQALQQQQQQQMKKKLMAADRNWLQALRGFFQ